MRTKLSEGIKIQAIVEIRDKNGKLKSVSKSKVRNLILDNFGKWLAGLIRAPSTGYKIVSLVDTSGVSRNTRTFSSGTDTFNNTLYGAAGTKIRVGSSETPPARGDHAIGTPFVTAPESGFFDTNTGSYIDGVITFSGSITAGGSGTIRETGFYARWWVTGNVYYDFMLFHDTISPAKPFVPNDSITVTYHITL